MPNIKRYQQFYIFQIQINIANFLSHPILYFQMLFTTLENNALILLRFSERTPSTSFFFSITGNIHYFKLL